MQSVYTLVIGRERHGAIWQAPEWNLESGDLGIYSIGIKDFYFLLVAKENLRDVRSPNMAKGGEGSVRQISWTDKEPSSLRVRV